jgi:hypothetical protein
VNRVTMGGLACGLALLLTACTSGGPSTDGPFGSTIQSSGGFCVPVARPGEVGFDGYEEFPNTGGKATIDKVRLVHPRHLRLVAAWVLLISDPSQRIGLGAGYPTASRIHSNAAGARWDLRQRIPGAVVRHTPVQQTIELLIVAKPLGKFGTSTAIDLYYESAGTRYLLHFPYGFSVRVGPTC